MNRLPAAGDQAVLLVMVDGEQIIAHVELTRVTITQHGQIDRGAGGQHIALDGMDIQIRGRTPGFVDYMPHPSDNTGLER